MMDENSRVIEKRQTFNCTLETMWWKWTTHEGLKSFFGFDNRIDLKPGGAYEVLFYEDSPKGEQGGEGNTVLSFVPYVMLSVSWNAPPEFNEVRNHEHKTWVVMNFRTVDSEHSEIHLQHLGWLEGGQWDEAFEYFTKAWDTGLKWLEESLEEE
jgi:uncharacterized protein YndB with AHSA1/START domain